MVWNPFTHRWGMEPWHEIEQLRREMERVFSGVNGARADEFPPIAVWTGAEGARLHALLPGLDAGNVDLAVSGDTLTLKGEREKIETRDDMQHRQERESGRFARTVQLPFPVEADGVKARFRDGVLEVELPRAATDKPRKIAVQANGPSGGTNMTTQKPNPQAVATPETAAPERIRQRPVFSPRTDIFENQDHVVLVAEMPGVDEKSVDVTLENDVLTIRGTTEEPAFEGMRLAYAEYRTGDYQRSFVLGDKVAASRIEASMKHGILRLVLPKEQPARKKIPVTTG